MKWLFFALSSSSCLFAFFSSVYVTVSLSFSKYLPWTFPKRREKRDNASRVLNWSFKRSNWLQRNLEYASRFFFFSNGKGNLAKRRTFSLEVIMFKWRGIRCWKMAKNCLFIIIFSMPMKNQNWKEFNHLMFSIENGFPK